MADKERRMAHDVREQTGTHSPEASHADMEEIDSQVVITLKRGEREPEIRCTKAGRMTGQMVMGLEGQGIMRLDNELRRAQLALRRREGWIPPENKKTLEERMFIPTGQLKEKAGG